MTQLKTIAIIFGHFGPYHHARAAVLQRAAGEFALNVIPLQIADGTTTYSWSGVSDRCKGLLTLCRGADERASPLEVFCRARALFRAEAVDLAFLPSYWPPRFFALLLAAKSLGIRTVMMNESHAGTQLPTKWRGFLKRQIVKRFDAALVGGEPQKRHFALLGIPAEKIFTGYDAVDNAHFAARADEVRSMEHGAQSMGPEGIRKAYGLPERYFLSLGRMVEKKNLATLVAAYAKFCEESRVASDESPRHAPASLVFVGSGELEGALREQARSLGLRVVERTDWKVGQSSHGFTRIDADGSERLAADRTEGNADCRMTSTAGGLSPETTDGEDSAATKTRDSLPATSHEENCGTVFFYGFRQIEENPVFYALAEAFVLPSLKEEWGLVVNEAMAVGLPVIVSRTAGCAEDLVPKARASLSSQLADGSIQSGEKNKTEDCKLLTDDSLEERSNGFVFDPKSSDALSEALRRIADQKTKRQKDQEPDGLTEMGRRSREIVERFSCENFARQALRAAEAASA